MKMVRRSLVGLVAAGFLLAPATAWASTAYQGSDSSYSVSSNLKMRVCDNEPDGHGVHADYDDFFGYGYKLDENGGAGSACETSDYVYNMSAVYRHRTVEELGGFQPDYKGDWSYH